MEHNMITSASGWRKVFAVSGDENDTTSDSGENNILLAALAAETFAEYISEKNNAPVVILGTDTRPTGPAIADAMLAVFIAKKITVKYAGIITAPAIMAYSRTADGFVYISASHNPIGHNGIKFGLNDGGVLSGQENARLVERFNELCRSEEAVERARTIITQCPAEELDWIRAESAAVAREALSTYRSFAKTVISGTENPRQQNKLFAQIRKTILAHPLGIVCDMNGSARTLSIDASFLGECGVSYHSINDAPGNIAHPIIPEPENLVWCAAEMKKLHEEGHSEVKLGYMPDCDGDRGNIVFWNEEKNDADVIPAQTVFALSVLSELAYSVYLDKNAHGKKRAVAVNGPTSLRIEEIAGCFGADVLRAEIGEANVVNLARKARGNGYSVRILGEGSNGGNITHPSAVRDPLSTLFALIKLLVVKDTPDENGSSRKGLFHLWCSASGQEEKYRDDFSLLDIMRTLPVYTTTGVAEERAVLHIQTANHGTLKANFQRIFESQWNIQKKNLAEKYGIHSYEAIGTVGTEEIRNLTDYAKSGKGGLKILFFDAEKHPAAFIWMRGSGTEPVFRVLCDVKGENQEAEQELLEWERQMILEADLLKQDASSQSDMVSVDF